MPLPRLLEMGYAQLHKDQQAFADTARRIDPNKKPEDVLKEMERDHPTADKLLASAQQQLDGLRQFPAINAEIRDSNIVYHNYCDIGVAIGGGKGLVVPVLRNAERMASGSARPKRNAEFKRLPSSVSEQPSASQVHLLSPPALRLRTSDSGLGTGLTPAARGGQPQPSHSGAGGAARQGQLLAGQRPDKVAHQPSHLCQSEIPVDLAQRRAL